MNKVNLVANLRVMQQPCNFWNLELVVSGELFVESNLMVQLVGKCFQCFLNLRELACVRSRESGLPKYTRARGYIRCVSEYGNLDFSVWGKLGRKGDS